MSDMLSPLSAERFERARTYAADQVRKQRRPDPATYRGADFSKYPPRVTLAATIALIIVGGAAFWLSAGKQIAASDLILGPLVGHYERLSPFWEDTAILLMLLLGEIGTVLFTTAHAIFGGSRLVKGAFYGAAFLCALFALIGNVTITSLHTSDIASLPVFGWFIAVAPPVVVLFVGLYGERLLLGVLEARATARQAFKNDMDAWEKVQRDPTAHSDYMRLFATAIIDQLRRVSARNKQILDAMVEANPGAQVALVQREMRAHQWANYIGEALALPDPVVPGVPAVPRGTANRAENAPDAEQTDGPVHALRLFAKPGMAAPLELPGTAEHVEQVAPPEPGPQMQKALLWLAESTDNAAMSVRSAAEACGVGLGTMARAKDQFNRAVKKVN